MSNNSNNSNLTYGQFMAMPAHEKTQAYMNHELNGRRNDKGQAGPSAQAQAAFVNDWQAAFASFADRLPNK